MGTLYRKVAVTEEKPQASGFYWIENIVGEMKSSYYDSRLKMFTGDYANFWLKPITENESLLKQNAEMRDLLNTIFLHIVPLKRMLEDPYKSGLKSRANQITELLTKYK